MRGRTGIRLVGDVVTIAVGALLLMGETAAPAHAQAEFTITGEVDGLYPGARTTLDARVRNPQPFPIRVTSVTVTAGDASPGCPSSMLEVGSATPAMNIAPGATGTVPIDVRMDSGAPDACQGATWLLAFTGKATNVGATAPPSADSPPGSDGPTSPGAESPSRSDRSTAPSAENPSGADGTAAPTATGPAGWAHTGANLALLVAIGASLIVAGRHARQRTRRR